MTSEARKRILCLDFDGVCHSYITKYEAADIIPDPPVDGMWHFIESAIHHFEIYIYSSRGSHPNGIQAMQKWFQDHAKSYYQLDTAKYRLTFTTTKPPAFLTLDDRCICFNGQWPDPEELLNFKPWNKTSDFKKG